MLGGGATALVGVVLYCVCLGRAEPSVPVGRAIEAAGLLGVLATASLVLGVGFWISACAGALSDMYADALCETEPPRR